MAQYQNRQDACFKSPGNFPYEIAKSDPSFGKRSAILRELVNAGLLEVEEARVKQSAFISTSSKTADGLRYSVTEKAESFVVPPKKPGMIASTELCFGDYKAVAVKTFSEPSDMMGQKISRVIYTYQLSNVAKWAQDSAVLQEYVPTLAKDIDSLSKPIKRESVLVLTDDGWVHEKLFSGTP